MIRARVRFLNDLTGDYSFFQLFGYTLEEIKEISGLFRYFLTIKNDLKSHSKEENTKTLSKMLEHIQALFERMSLMREGMERWEDLPKSKKKEKKSPSKSPFEVIDFILKLFKIRIEYKHKFCVLRTSMLNQRKEKRFSEENDAFIQYALNNKNPNNHIGINALTQDISLSGARIITKKIFPIDTVLRTQINLSRTKQVIKVDGKVKWIRENAEDDSYEIGIEFLHEISKTVLTLIRHLYGEETGIPSKIISDLLI